MDNNEPVILGKIKRGKTGKPLVVLILFLIVGIFILFLPNISNYVKQTFLGENKNENIDMPINTNNKVEEPKLINNKTIIKYEKITLNNFNLSTKDINFNVLSNVSIEDSNYYLVLEKDNKNIEYIKLLNGNNIFEFITELDNTLNIKGYIKFIKENEYPSFTLSSDESGLGNLICEKDNKRYEYVFSKNLLIKVKETYSYNNSNIDGYYKEYQNYNNIVNKINNSGGISTVVENIEGFTFKSEIDLSVYTGILDKNYYSFNTNCNKINFEMKAKGYDCK